MRLRPGAAQGPHWEGGGAAGPRGERSGDGGAGGGPADDQRVGEAWIGWLYFLVIRGEGTGREAPKRRCHSHTQRRASARIAGRLLMSPVESTCRKALPDELTCTSRA